MDNDSDLIQKKQIDNDSDLIQEKYKQDFNMVLRPEAVPWRSKFESVLNTANQGIIQNADQDALYWNRLKVDSSDPILQPNEMKLEYYIEFKSRENGIMVISVSRMPSIAIQFKPQITPPLPIPAQNSVKKSQNRFQFEYETGKNYQIQLVDEKQKTILSNTILVKT